MRAELHKERLEREQQELYDEARKQLAPNQPRQTNGSSTSESQQETQIITAPRLLISDVVDKFVEERRNSGDWRTKTEKENIAVYALFERILENIPFASIKHEEIRDYKATLQKLPQHVNKIPACRGKTIPQILQIKGLPRLSTTTVNKSLSRVGTLFDWAVRHGYTDRNYAQGITIKQKKNRGKPRIAFSEKDLEKMFFSDEYLRQNKKSHRHEYCFWLPLLGLFTAARLEELCQLHLSDIYKSDSVNIIHIRDEGKDQQLKNDSSRRIIPIHKQLVKLGFLNYVEQLHKKNEERLFPELKLAREKYSDAASRWFSRYKRRCGIEIPDDKLKDFHSFRHLVAGHLQQKSVPQPQVQALLGHTIDSITFGTYGDPYKPKVLAKVVAQIEYDLDLTPLLSSSVNPYV